MFGRWPCVIKSFYSVYFNSNFMALMPSQNQLVSAKQFYYKYYFTEFPLAIYTIICIVSAVFAAHNRICEISCCSKAITVGIKYFMTMCKLWSGFKGC